MKLEPLIAAKAKEKQREAGGAVPQKSVKPPIDTQKELAKLAGVSHDTNSLPANLPGSKCDTRDQAAALLAAMEKHRGGRPNKNRFHDVTGLSDIGISKIQSHRWQVEAGRLRPTSGAKGAAERNQS